MASTNPNAGKYPLLWRLANTIRVREVGIKLLYISPPPHAYMCDYIHIFLGIFCVEHSINAKWVKLNDSKYS